MQFYQQSTQHVYSSRICIPVRQESSILTKGLSMIIPCIARPYHSFSHQATATCSPTATIGVVTRQDREFLVYLLSVQLATWPMGWMSFIVLVGRFSEVDHETELATKNKKGLLIFMGFALVGWKKRQGPLFWWKWWAGQQVLKNKTGALVFMCPPPKSYRGHVI